jgi:MFS family permease
MSAAGHAGRETAPASPIPPGLTLRLGVSQLVCWGISYYLVGVFAQRMAAELRWSAALVQGGFSASLLVMGISSPAVGRLIDRRGGQPVMAAGSCLTALGCALLAAARSVGPYYAAWILLGLGMRMTLYEAAFAALARIGGPRARRSISQVTLLGGLASTVFWPIGNALADAFGWRRALLVYAGLALLTIPLHLAIPRGRFEPAAEEPRSATGPRARTPGERALAASLYAAITTLTTFLNSGMSAHMIGILAALGLGASLAVWISTLRGVGQSSARLCEIVFGARVSPLLLAVVASALLPVSFAAGSLGGASRAAAVGFAFVYGAGNGLVTIARGTLPLVLFDPRSYGSVVGGLLVPSFVAAALAPLAYSLAVEGLGAGAALHASTGVAALVLAASIALWARFSRPPGR